MYSYIKKISIKKARYKYYTSRYNTNYNPTESRVRKYTVYNRDDKI